LVPNYSIEEQICPCTRVTSIQLILLYSDLTKGLVCKRDYGSRALLRRFAMLRWPASDDHYHGRKWLRNSTATLRLVSKHVIGSVLDFN